MNPMTNVKNVLGLSARELTSGAKSSWHDQYRDSAWVFVGGLPYDLTEGDIICVFSQYGEVVNINLVRDKATGKQKGFCFLCYEDQRSTILAVDNLNGTKILGRTIRVDHCENYKVPQDSKKNPVDEETARLRAEGCAPQIEMPPPLTAAKLEMCVSGDIVLPMRLPIRDPVKVDSKKPKKDKKSKKEKKNKKKKRKKESESSESSDSTSEEDSQSKRKKHKKK